MRNINSRLHQTLFLLKKLELLFVFLNSVRTPIQEQKYCTVKYNFESLVLKETYNNK